MKILFINDYKNWGWAEVIWNLTYKLFDNSNILYLEDLIWKNKLFKLFNMLFFNIFLYFKLKKVIKEFKPDIIHLHNYNLSPITVLLAIKNYKSVQTVHASWQICPSSWGVYRKNYKKCNLKPWFKKCMTNCFFDKPKIPWIIYYFWHRFVVKLRKKYTKWFIFPSQALKKWFEINWFKNLVVISNPIVFDIKKESNVKKENIILYVWKIIKLKWVDILVESLLKTDIDNYKFIFVWDWPLLNKLKEKTKNDNRFNFLWKVSHDEVINYHLKSKIVVVPSIWFDNYPTSIIEWLLTDNIIIWFDRWWIKELLWENLTINIDSWNYIDKLNKKINEIVENYNKYKEISLERKEMILKNNFVEKYKEKLEKFYSLILK